MNWDQSCPYGYSRRTEEAVVVRTTGRVFRCKVGAMCCVVVCALSTATLGMIKVPLMCYIRILPT